ncbi:MAG: hypothetical protein AMXMBFR84_05740 [Candidatus Hydrogenedentota bacterium]
MQPERALGAIALMLVLLAFKAGHVGMAVWLHAAYSERMQRISLLYRTRAVECAVIGLVNTLVLFFVGLLLISTRVLALVGLLIWGSVIVMAAFGYAAGYRRLGERMIDPDATTTRIVLLGGIAAESAFLAPVIGQLFSISVFLRGVGAVVLTTISKKAGTSQSEMGSLDSSSAISAD